MSAFDVVFANTLAIEQGYSNNPADPGGATMWGITERVARANGYMGDMRQLPQATASAIAKKVYWDPYLLDQMPVVVGFQVFDIVYNGGQAVKWLQQALAVTADGVVGAQTVAAARAADPWKVVALMNASRLEYYAGLGQLWPTFGKGWARRVAANLRKGDLQ
jgi:lysozyme family protein